MAEQKQFFLEGITPFVKGIGQIMLQNNLWTGLFFFAGICCGSLSVLIMVQMRSMDLPALTFPFVLATWITLMIKIGKQTIRFNVGH